MFKLAEGFVSSFQYKPPTDPEQLLYDFYFFVGYVNPSDFTHEEDTYALLEAINDCVNNLHKHMLSALKFALSAEFRHYKVFTLLGNAANKKRIWNNFPSHIQQFLLTYEKEFSYRASEHSLSSLDPRVRRNLKKIKQDPLYKDETDATDSTGRHSYYLTSFRSLVAAQKKLNLTDLDIAKILIYMFKELTWASNYGGKAWANIAETYKNLLLSTTLQEKIVWIDHAYDLQHNTGTIFTKLRTYYKRGGFSWIALALDWKKDQTDLRKFQSKVSTSVKPLVGYIAYKKGIEDPIVPAVKPSTEQDKTDTSSKQKAAAIDTDMTTKCKNCGYSYGQHHYGSNACPEGFRGSHPITWSTASVFRGYDLTSLTSSPAVIRVDRPIKKKKSSFSDFHIGDKVKFVRSPLTQPPPFINFDDNDPPAFVHKFDKNDHTILLNFPSEEIGGWWVFPSWIEKVEEKGAQ